MRRASGCSVTPRPTALGRLSVCLDTGIFPRPVAQQPGSAGGAAQGQRRPRGEGRGGGGGGRAGQRQLGEMGLEQNKGVTAVE